MQSSSVATPPRSSLRIFKSVVFALMLREMHTRFGKLNIGYVWAIVDPAAQVVMLTFILGFAAAIVMPGVAFPVFVLTGVLPYGLFRAIVTQNMAAIDANRGLFGYRQVKPFDAFVARTTLEMVIHLVTFLVLIGTISWLGWEVTIFDPLMFIAVALLMALFSFSLGILLTIAASFNRELRKIIPLALTPFFFISGVFYPMKAIPEKYLPLIIWNPLLHFIELLREAYFESYPRTDRVSLLYLVFITLVATFAAMASYRANRLRLVTS